MRAGNRAHFAALYEINFVEAPEIRGEMHAGAAHAASIDQRALLLGFILRRFAKRGGLQLGMIGQQVFAQHADFVVGVIRFA